MYNFEFNDPLFLPHLGCRLHLSLNPGEIIVLAGQNGIGKTTLVQRIYEQLGQASAALVEQVALDYFFDRQLHRVKTIFFNTNPIDLRSTTNNLWSELGLSSRESRYLSQLSGGEGQLLKLFFGLSKEAPFYLLDEPSHHLDVNKKSLLKEIIKSYCDEGKTFLVVEHDLAWLPAGTRVQLLEVQQDTLVAGKTWII